MPTPHAGATPLVFDETGSGPPVLLVHGLLNDSRMWASVARELARDYQVIRCDLRGCGRTPRVGPGHRKDSIRDLLQLLDALAIPSAHLAGYGSGAAVVAGLAMRAPERARSLTLVDPVVPRANAAATVQQAWHVETLLQWLSVGYGEAVRHPDHIRAIQAVVAQQTHARQAVGNPIDPAPPLGAGHAFNLAHLNELNCPVLTLIGQQASAEVKSVIQSLLPAKPDLRLDQVPGAARNCAREAPAVVARMMQQFWESTQAETVTG